MKTNSRVRESFCLPGNIHFINTEKNKIIVLSRTQIKELKDEIAELTENLQHTNGEQQNIIDER